MKRGIATFTAGLLAGALLFGGGSAARAGIAAEPSAHKIYVDGVETPMSAYRIQGNNYVMLRDVGKAVGFNVYWQDGVQIDTYSFYTGEPPMDSVLLEEGLVPMSPLPAGELDDLRQEIVDRTNRLRRSKGLPELKMDPKTMEAAQVRAEEMAASTVYAHTRPDGRKRTTVTDCPYTAENIHCISQWHLKELRRDLPEVVVEEWAASEDHLNSMLDPSRSCIGVGVAQGVSPSSGLPAWYCVQWFLREGCQITWVDGPAEKPGK